MGLLRLAGLPGQGNRFRASDEAALTYGRRYALFTRVGIVDQDDLDARP